MGHDSTWPCISNSFAKDTGVEAKVMPASVALSSLPASCQSGYSGNLCLPQNECEEWSSWSIHFSHLDSWKFKTYTRQNYFYYFTISFIIFLFLKIIYLFIFGCVGSLFLCEGFLQLRQAGAALHRGARASHHRGLSRFGAQAPDAQAQQLRLTGLVAPRHVGSSQTRARTRVPCVGRQTPNHCATREALGALLIPWSLMSCWDLEVFDWMNQDDIMCSLLSLFFNCLLFGSKCLVLSAWDYCDFLLADNR